MIRRRNQNPALLLAVRLTLVASSVGIAAAASHPIPNTPCTVIYDLGTATNDPVEPARLGLIAVGSDGNLYSTCAAGGDKHVGCIYMVTPTGAMKIVHSCTVAEGANPWSGLHQDKDGAFYGTCNSGGKYAAGTIFKINADGSYSTLFDFRNGKIVPALPYGQQPTKQELLDAAGSYPISGPVLANDGNLYGVVPTGNIQQNGILYRLTSSGDYKGLHNFQDEKLNYPCALIAGKDGNLYGTALIGPGRNQCAVFKATIDGNVTILKILDGAFGSGPYNLMQATDGDIYGTCQNGGSSKLGYSRGVLFKITPGGDSSVIHTFIGADGGTPIAGVTQGKDGLLYGVADQGSTFYRLRPDGSDFTVLFTFNKESGAFPAVPLVELSDGKFYGLTGGFGKYYSGTVFSLDPTAPKVTDVRLATPTLTSAGGQRTVEQCVYVKGSGKGMFAGTWILDNIDTGQTGSTVSKYVDLSTGGWVNVGTFQQVLSGHHTLKYRVLGENGPVSSTETMDITEFVPSMDGWNFDNVSMHYKWAGILGLFPQYANEQGELSTTAGACEGFTISARDYFDKRTDLKLPPRPLNDGETLDIDELILQDHVFGNVWRKQHDAPAQSTDVDAPNYQSLIEQSATAIQQQVASGDPCVVDFYVLPVGATTGGHACVAEASFFAANVISESANGSPQLSDQMYLFSIYDPNFPGDNNRYVEAFEHKGTTPTVDFRFNPMPSDFHTTLKIWFKNSFHTPRPQ